VSYFVVSHWFALDRFRLVSLVVLAVLLLPVPDTLPAETESEIVQGNVKAMLEATYAGDVDRVLKYTHPRILELMGGQEASRAAITAALASITRLQLKVDNLTFPRSPKFFKGANHRYVFVPTLLVLSVAGGQKLESLNYQLGILDPGSSQWRYVEGSRVNQSNARQLFSDFPTDIEFPPLYRKKL
jgi:hypothetical protein